MFCFQDKESVENSVNRLIDFFSSFFLITCGMSKTKWIPPPGDRHWRYRTEKQTDQWDRNWRVMSLSDRAATTPHHTTHCSSSSSYLQCHCTHKLWSQFSATLFLCFDTFFMGVNLVIWMCDCGCKFVAICVNLWLNGSGCRFTNALSMAICVNLLLILVIFHLQ